VKALVGPVALLLVAASVAVAGRPTQRLPTEGGVSLVLPRGWHGLASPGQLQAADFRLGGRALGSPELARVPRGHVHVIVWDYGPSVPYLANFRPARTPLALDRRDFSGPLEGFAGDDAFAVRNVTLDEELLELVADLGPKPLSSSALRKANTVLATLRVRPPRIVRPRGRTLASGGVALRLLPGWTGRIELPPDRRTARLVVRARRGNVRVVLLELADVSGAHADLPVTLARRNILTGRRGRLHVARRVFSSAGRGFDLSVVVSSPAELAIANRLLQTLTAVTRPWTFRSCDLSIRLPGTWRAAIDPRSGCYPVITLRAPGLRIVITELRPRESAGGGRILARAGRRFGVRATPRSDLRETNAILATLRAKPRS
jgi:hypothetical protein